MGCLKITLTSNGGLIFLTHHSNVHERTLHLHSLIEKQREGKSIGWAIIFGGMLWNCILSTLMYQNIMITLCCPLFDILAAIAYSAVINLTFFPSISLSLFFFFFFCTLLYWCSLWLLLWQPSFALTCTQAAGAALAIYNLFFRQS